MKHFHVLLTGLVLSALLSSGAVAQEARGVDPVYPMSTENSTVVSVYHQYQIMLEEINESQSKGAMILHAKDYARWMSYVALVEAIVVRDNEFGIPDYAATHGMELALGEPLNPQCEFKDNIHVCDLLRQVISARNELVVSDSNDLARSLVGADYVRQSEYWDLMRKSIEFIAQWTPGDEPITAAEEAIGITPPLSAIRNAE